MSGASVGIVLKCTEVIIFMGQIGEGGGGGGGGPGTPRIFSL